MTEDQVELLQKARQSLSAARLLLSGGYPDYAASRAYYTMFYIAEAFLEGEDMFYEMQETTGNLTLSPLTRLPFS